jgi:hypothetical protein
MIRTALAFCTLAGLAVSSASATVIATGSLSSATGAVVAGGNYANTNGGFVIAWTVIDNSNGTWTYRYTFNRLNGNPVTMPGVSHLTLQLSDNFTTNDLIGVGPTVQQTTLGTFSGGPADPGWPGGSLFGIKLDFTSNPMTAELTTNRLPMWGSFYVKGGASSFAYNADFLAVAANQHDYWNPPVDGLGNPLALILVPNVIPTPGAVALLGVGGLLAGRRRR